MSDYTIISPLLDGFSMGTPISDHNGIRCCPAIKENTDKKYIVKIVASPASQGQMDAMLLAGAFRDTSGAMDYFQEQAKGVLKEAELLRQLSKLEGFLSYEGWQMEPITRYRLGYEVYLLGSYKRSLDKYMKHNAITHLEAINLGLDMCNALSVARQAGYLYVDLKPSNIFLSEKKEYRIGDLGFLDLKELRFSALPQKYLSSYTPPELYDPMNSVNLTADTYALGMLLYQLYHDGHLPFRGKPPEEALPNPAHADYELAEIILKAIHPDPEQRYSDPKEMGKALASYLQRNSINDVAITPLKTKKVKSKKKAPQEELPESAEVTPLEPEESTDPQTSAPEEPAEEIAAPEIPSEEPQLPEEAPELPDELPEAVTPLPESDEDAPPEEVSDETSADDETISFSGDMARVMEKADDLISYELPEELLVPEEEDPFAFVLDEEDELDDSDIPEDPLMDEPPNGKRKKKSEKKFANSKHKKRGKGLVKGLIFLVILALIAFGGFWYYQNLFLQTVRSITIDGDQREIRVMVDSDIPDEKLTLICTSSSGSAESAALTGGSATFTGLQPNTMYTLQLEISGFHALQGQTSQIYTTEATTSIVSFTSAAGSEDGSVLLNFTVDGDEPPFWTLNYIAEGEEPRQETFTGHSININGLTLGKVYTFTLDAGENRSLSGQSSLELMASRLILAENLTVVSGSGTDMTIRWDTPGDVVVESWDVRCYSPMGYDEQITVTENQVQFTGIDPAHEYTIEVTAAGMTQPARTGITANPVNVTTLNVNSDEPDKLKLNWEFTGNEPVGGWLMMYAIDGGENHVIKCDTASATISPKVPSGKYTFSIQAADGTSIFNSNHSFTVAEAIPYEGNSLKQEQLTCGLVKTPQEKWYAEGLPGDAVTTQFAAGDPISIVLRSSDNFYLPGYQTNILYIIRDSYGNVLSQYLAQESIAWKNIWNGGDAKNGELDIPNVPSNPGEYRVDLYFDGMAVTQLNFTIA